MCRSSNLLWLFLVSLVVSCVTSDKGFDRKNINSNEEFAKVIKIEKIEEPIVPEKVDEAKVKKKSKSLEPQKKPSKLSKDEVQKDATKSSEVKQAPSQPEKVSPTKKIKKNVKKQKRMPLLEDSEGFDGRRPIVEPYRVGEEVVLGISYFAVEAGKFTMQVRPMVQVNGKKSYHFRYLIQTSSLFSMFYKVDDVAETFVEYESLLPYSYEIHVNESKQVRETRTYFDHVKNKATMWDKKQKKNKSIESKKIQWDLNEYSQNVFSSAYYLRNFTLRVGKKLKINVGHEGKNIIMTAEVLRKEKLFTDVGVFNTFVVRPTFNIDGKFKPVGDNLLWLTADDRKFIVRLESKIKIGTIVGEVQKIKK